MKIGYGFAMLVVGAMLLPASPSLANVQSDQLIAADRAVSGHFQIAQTPTGRGCPKGTRYDTRSQMCVKTGG